MKWVDAINLQQWADRTDARTRLPELVRRLIYATTPDLREIDVPAGDAGQRPGWDGIVVTGTASPHVPAGLSLWEMGCDRDPREKAEEDFAKRTKEPRGRNPSAATFISVTPRMWSGKDAWVQAKRALGTWNDVRAYDASDLEQWLTEAPAVGAWLAPIVGTWPSDDVQAAEAYWDEWTAATLPPTHPDLLLAGREAQQKAVLDWLQGPPATLAIEADTTDEAAAFAIAVIKALPANQREQVEAQVILVRNEGAYRRLAATRNGLVLVPLFPITPGLIASAASTHRVLLTRPNAGLRGPAVALAPMDKYATARILEGAGMPEAQARRVAWQAGDSLSSLRRILSASGGTDIPLWAEAIEGTYLAPALLAGAWDGANASDRAVIEALTGSSYDELETRLVRWASAEGAPLRRSGTTWRWASPAGAWDLLARFITSSALDRFEAVVHQVLGAGDPKYDLPADERWLANLKGATLTHTGLLRDGLAHALAALSGHPASDRIADKIRPSQRVARVVRSLLHEQPWKRWASLSDALPLLAEAAPDDFLDAADAGLRGGTPALAGIFNEGNDALFSSSPHTGLLWALEGLAWSSDYLTQVALTLGALARLDPGGKLANRPAASLRSIFLSWYPQTAAPVPARFAALDRLITREPSVAWKLLVALLPQPGGDSSGENHKPHWRQWHIGASRRVATREVWKFFQEVADRVLLMLGSDIDRWVEILDRPLASVPDSHIDRLLEQFEEFERTLPLPDARLRLWGALRGAVHTHRRFTNSEWALPQEAVDRLAALYSRLEPASLVDRVAWLFSSSPQLPEVAPYERDDAKHSERYEAEQLAIREAREAAVRELVAVGSLPHLVEELLERVENAFVLGRFVGQVPLADLDEGVLLRMGITHDRDRHAFLNGFVAGRFATGSWEWADRVLQPGGPHGLTHVEVGHCARGLLFERRTWTQVDSLNEEGQRIYWSAVEPWLPAADIAREAVTRLLAASRPYTAWDVIAGVHGDKKDDIPSALIVDVLFALAAGDRNAEPASWRLGSFGYWLGVVFATIDKRGDVSDEVLARLEWVFLPVLASGSHRQPHVLQRELAHSPELFVEVLGAMYRREGEEGTEATAEQEGRAHRAHDLLQSWHGVPGQTEDGFDVQGLRDWVSRARQLASEAGRSKVADETIGQILARVPSDPNDGAWPALPVRDLLEEFASTELEIGVYLGRVNSRGVITRDFAAGGAHERALAATYREKASKVAAAWPRSAKLLRDLAERYDTEAHREDVDAALQKAKY